MIANLPNRSEEEKLALLEQIFAVYRERGGRSYGENVTELQHALQCAEFATQQHSTKTVVLAALLHDYGHLLHDEGEDIAERGIDTTHEELGAKALSAWFGPEIVDPIQMHVAAKRYLCWAESTYHASLSAASQLSLTLQGGPMNDAEAKAFASRPHFAAALQVRRFDDWGKVPGMETAPLEAYRDLLLEHLR